MRVVIRRKKSERRRLGGREGARISTDRTPEQKQPEKRSSETSVESENTVREGREVERAQGGGRHVRTSYSWLTLAQKRCPSPPART